MSQLKTELLAEIEKVLNNETLAAEFKDAGITNLDEIKEAVTHYGVKRLSAFNSRLLPVLGSLGRIAKIRAMVPASAWKMYKIMETEGLQEQILLEREQNILVEAWKNTRGKTDE